jgi:hypothetical protein
MSETREDGRVFEARNGSPLSGSNIRKRVLYREEPFVCPQLLYRRMFKRFVSCFLRKLSQCSFT